MQPTAILRARRALWRTSTCMRMRFLLRMRQWPVKYEPPGYRDPLEMEEKKCMTEELLR